MNTDDHPLIHFNAMTDEKPPALLKIKQSIGQCLASGHGHQYPVIALSEIPVNARGVMIEGVVHQSGA